MPFIPGLGAGGQIINEGPNQLVNLSGIQPANRIVSVPGLVEAPGYREKFSATETEVTRFFDIPWAQRKNFADTLLGYSATSGAGVIAGALNITRTAPDNHPEYPWLYAVELEMADAMGAVVTNQASGLIQYVNADPTSNGAGNVRWKATYRALDYEVYTDKELAGLGGKEINRYVSRNWVWSVQSLPIPNANLLKYAEGPNKGRALPANTNAQVLLFPMREVTYTWHQVPDVPQVTIDQLTGSVNSTIFDAPLQVAGQGGGPNVPVGGYGSQTQGYPPGTLLCMTPQVERKRNIVGRVSFEIAYKFLYRPAGWNKFPDFSTGQPGFYTMTFDGKALTNTNCVFQQNEFALLFQMPGASSFYQNAQG